MQSSLKGSTVRRRTQPGGYRSQAFARAFCTLMAMAAFLITPRAGLSQSASRKPLPPMDVFGEMQSEGANPHEDAIQAKRWRMQIAQRRRNMIADADKLLQLAEELNSTLTDIPAALRIQKAAEIQRLAHQVKDMMRFTVDPPQAPQFPLTGWSQ